MSKLKEQIKGVAHFKCYKDSQLWYVTTNGFLFPVPIEDIGSATFNNVEKASLMMRYIRKQIKIEEEALN